MALTKDLQELCERQALSFILSEWDDSLTYEDIVDILSSSDWQDDDRIMVWGQLEDLDDIAETLEGLCGQFQFTALAGMSGNEYSFHNPSKGE
jgi:hypothetical protein